MLESKRNLIFVPELSAATFVFFYYEGNRDSRSYSVRDYSQPGLISVRYAREFPYTAGEILDLSAREGNHRFPAPKRRTDDLSFWHTEVVKLNERCLNGSARPHVPRLPGTNPTELRPLFPMLNVEQLIRHPKAKKRGDLQRIFTSPNSEDYATWNVFHLLQKRPAELWWPEFIALAERRVPGIAAELDADDVPEVKLWNTVAAPTEYERCSRERMRQSSSPDIVLRSQQRDPVEGASEIDITFEGRSYLIYIEAKLNHDISTGTTHDVERDQISRNIDCLLENCGERRPYFWMTVRDDGPGWLYTQRVDFLRKGTREFLPHRPQETTGHIAKGIILFLWPEVLEIATRNLPEDELTTSVRAELRRRFGLMPNLLPPANGAGAEPLEHDCDLRGIMDVSEGIVSEISPAHEDRSVMIAPPIGQAAKHLAIAQMYKQISQFALQIERLKEAIEIMRRQVEPEEDRTVVVEASGPSTGAKRCACGCGRRVIKHAYVWGHKSGSRLNTIPMREKGLGVSSAVATARHLAIGQMHEQIGQFEQQIEKLKEAIEIMRRQAEPLPWEASKGLENPQPGRNR